MRPLSIWSVAIAISLVPLGAARIARALRGAGNTDLAVRIFPGADHTFRLAPGSSGWPITASGYVPSLLEWLAKR